MSTKVDRRYARDHQREKFSWKVFLKPGWVLGILVIIAFSYFAFSFLAPWQLNKDDDIVQRNEQIEASFEAEPVPYQQVLDENGAVDEAEEWTRVTLTGHYLGDKEALLRLRPVENTPTYQGLTPFQTTDGDVILVNRGFVLKPGNEMPEISPAPGNEVTIVGHARLNEVTPANPPLVDQGRLQVYGIDTGQIGETVDEDLGESYLQLSEGSPGELSAMPVPKLDRGSHLSYGFQWIAFGVMAPIGLGYFIWAEIRERRRVRAEETELEESENASEAAAGPAPGPASPVQAVADDATPDDSEDPELQTADAGPVPQSARSRDVRARYGGQHTDFWSRRSRHTRERF
ncbi:SURF1 family protein [Corynebacterium halotolerans]|uniref:SURF1 family cytochrome oxidase biogenesis protein n=1 Tax=Corynebacterium halotolerans TaxID=225326 RepID=UPI003CF6DD09